MNKKWNFQYAVGAALKKRAEMLLNLTPEEQNVFNKFQVRAVPQEELNRRSFPDRGMSQIQFDSPGFTSSESKKFVDVAVRNKFPYTPNLTIGNAKNLPPYITEEEVIAHELGHARDLARFGGTNERSAIGFEKRIVNRRGGEGTDRARLMDALIGRRGGPDYGILGQDVPAEEKGNEKRKKKFFYHPEDRLPWRRRKSNAG